ncbi:MAG TPA: prepilin-type N-terminal cleavage/methylation domain-containing protein [Vicinamibacterales bacterium]|jgi:prepilin-type N-terminal cleavage/methylation domain-containing protein|nr:prepilin-type N-terminal cleavage/methylation domain-containing protein [Vicinamibacterales bacterium]
MKGSGHDASAVEHAGFTLVELLVSTTIMLAIASVVVSLLGPARRASRLQPEVSDLQQRSRVAFSALYGDLVMAGAGPYHGAEGARVGPLGRFFAPILPYRAGRTGSDPARGVFFREDAVTILYVPATTAQAVLATRVDPGTNIVLDLQPGCPEADAACGFEKGMTLLLFDGTTAWDAFEVIEVVGSALQVTHRGHDFTRPYGPGSTVVQAEWHTYYFDGVQHQLRHYDGLHTDVPVVDNVADVRFTYFGSADPPVEPKPEPGDNNCVIDRAGVPMLARLSSADGSLIELTSEMLSDGGPGPVVWCGANGHLFDPDLLRIRRVRVQIRLQAGADVRQSIPDTEMILDVSPRNLDRLR